MSEQEKDNWDKIQIFGLLLIPLIVVILGFRFDASLKRIDSQARMTEIAVGILR